MGKNTKAAVDLFNCLYGSYLSLKRIHFTTTHQAEHLRTDEMMSEVLDYADAIMENCMGLFGRISKSDLNYCEFGTFETDKEVYNAIRTKLAAFRVIIEKNVNMNGVLNIVDEFAQKINRYIYLSDNS